jgi:isocitrate/isopropylmalate dehydrogenase
MRSPLADPDGIDYIILRENSEGLYPGREGELRDLVNVMPDLSDRTGRKVKEFGDEGRFAVKIVTPRGAERIARFACELARKRKARGKPGKITCITKSNVLRAPTASTRRQPSASCARPGSSSSTSTSTTPPGASSAFPNPWT